MEIISRFTESKKKVECYQLRRRTVTYNVLNQGHWHYGEALGRLRVPYTIDVLLPRPDVHASYDFSGVRWHGSGDRPSFIYRDSEEHVQGWIPRVDGAGRAGVNPGYYNDHVRIALSRASIYWEGKLSEAFEARTASTDGLMVEKMLLAFADAESIAIARSISDEAFSLREESIRLLVADIGDTSVEINLEDRTIVHRCPTWAKSDLEQKFCAHIVKLLLSINKERARVVLALIRSNLNGWKFQSRVAGKFPTYQPLV